MVPGANVGANAPVLSFSPIRFALLAGARVMVRVYVWVVTPSCAVTTMLIVLAPTASVIGAEAVLLATAAPFTDIDEAVASSKAGVTVTELVAFGTLEV